MILWKNNQKTTTEKTNHFSSLTFCEGFAKDHLNGWFFYTHNKETKLTPLLVVCFSTTMLMTTRKDL